MENLQLVKNKKFNRNKKQPKTASPNFLPPVPPSSSFTTLGFPNPQATTVPSNVSAAKARELAAKVSTLRSCSYGNGVSYSSRSPNKTWKSKEFCPGHVGDTVYWQICLYIYIFIIYIYIYHINILYVVYHDLPKHKEIYLKKNNMGAFKRCSLKKRPKPSSGFINSVEMTMESLLNN